MIITDPAELTALVHQRLPDDWGEHFYSVDGESVAAKLPWDDRFAGNEYWGASQSPVVSGPVTMGLADTTMYGCCLAATGPTSVPVIVTITTTFLSPALPTDLDAVATLVRHGRRISYLECTLRNTDASQPFLRSVATYAIRNNNEA